MLYEAGIFWRTDKNIQVKLYFIPVGLIIELGNFTVMSITTLCLMQRQERDICPAWILCKDTWGSFVPAATPAWCDAALERGTNMCLEAVELF